MSIVSSQNENVGAGAPSDHAALNQPVVQHTREELRALVRLGAHEVHELVINPVNRSRIAVIWVDGTPLAHLLQQVREDLDVTYTITGLGPLLQGCSSTVNWELVTAIRERLTGLITDFLLEYL